MSIPNDALRKVLLEIEQKSIQSSQQIGIVKSQIAGKSKQARMVQLTASEVGALPAETPVYEGVGKMFVQAPQSEVVQRLETEGSELKSDTESLEKKLHYLETTYKNSREGIERLLQSAGAVAG